MSRTAAHPIEPLILRRWSARAMSGAPIESAVLMRLFEAARWAPSGGNKQPWRFVYALRDTPAFDGFLATLDPGNQEWCVRASALILVLSTSFAENGRSLPTHSFDTGAAWMSLALQGTAMGLVVHAMGGFDHDAARSVAAVPQDHRIECMVAVGYPGKPTDLSERNRARERPSDRRPVTDFAFSATFGNRQT